MPIPGTEHQECFHSPSGKCYWQLAYQMLRDHVTDPKMAATPGKHLSAGILVIDVYLTEEFHTDLRTLQDFLRRNSSRWLGEKSAQDEGDSATG